MESAVRIIEEILNHEDIEGLLDLGAPRDEYEAEAKLIEERVRHVFKGGLNPARRQEQTAAEIRDVWQSMFGPLSEGDLAQREDAFNRVAAQIISSLSTRI